MMLRKLRELVRAFDRDTEGRLRLELSVAQNALRDSLRDSARERAESMDALRAVTAQCAFYKAEINQMRLEVAVVRERRDRWRARVAPSEDRVVALTKEMRATQGRLRAAVRQVEQLKQAAKAREEQHEAGRLELMAGAAEALRAAVADLVRERDEARAEVERLTKSRIHYVREAETLKTERDKVRADLAEVVRLARETAAERDQLAIDLAAARAELARVRFGAEIPTPTEVAHG